MPMRDCETTFWIDSDRTVAGEYLYDATAPYYEPHKLAQRSGGNCWDYRDDASLAPSDAAALKHPILPYTVPRNGRHANEDPKR